MALEKAREIKSQILSSHLSTERSKAISEYIDEIIPELAESEDERIISNNIDELNLLKEIKNYHEKYLAGLYITFAMYKRIARYFYFFGKKQK